MSRALISVHSIGVASIAEFANALECIVVRSAGNVIDESDVVPAKHDDPMLFIPLCKVTLARSSHL